MNPITREESLLDGQDLTPITRKEQFIKRIYDKTQEIPEPITREEWFLKKAGEGTSPVAIEQLNVTENGTYSETGKAYSPVIVEVPAPTLITKTITENGTYNASEDSADGYSSVTVAVEGYKRKSIANTPTGIASFDDGTANPMPSLEISIEPVQSGSGDPSPSNVRPISGWSGVDVAVDGKNLFDESTATIYSKWISTEDKWVNESSSGCFAFMCRPNTTYTISVSDESAVFRVGLLNQNPSTAPDFVQLTNVVRSMDKSPITITTNSDTVCIIIQGGNSLVTIRNLKAQVELGSTATAYEPYNGHSVTIQLGQTVYGGRLNVTSGELTATMANVDLGTLSWTYQLAGTRFTADLTDVKKSASTSSRANIICSKYITGTPDNTWNALNNVIAISNLNKTVLIRDTAYTDAASFTTAMNGVQLVYELDTPITYQLTPAQVTTLLGQNNIFADCGQILEGEYFVTL